MQQDFEENTNLDSADDGEYSKFIKSSVADGSYFQDALDWYFFRYLSPICDRTLLIFGAVIAAVVLFFLVKMVQSAFPLVQKVPIFIQAENQALYFPNLVQLKPKSGSANYDPAITSVDQAVLKYLLSVYVRDRESYDFTRGEVDDVNKKINRVKNISSADEYRSFQLIMSKDNPDSPIQQFGRDVVKTVEIESVNLIKKEPQNFTEKAKEYLANRIPTSAEVRFIATTIATTAEEGDKITKERYLAQIGFDFSGVDKDKKGSLNFVVSNYKLFKVK